MNQQEAKFVLNAYRPNGRDEHDPAFADALALSREDPALGAWLAREREFDAAVSAKLAAIAPPADLRTAILASLQAERPRAAWWRQPWLGGLAAAAAVVVATTVTVRQTANPPNAYELARFAVNDSGENTRNHLGSVVPAVEGRLALGDMLRTAGGQLDLAALKAKGCRTVRVAGHDVFELCFGANHEFHLYVAHRGDFDATPEAGAPLFIEHGRLASVTWADSRHVYSLVTDAGMDRLRRML